MALALASPSCTPALKVLHVITRLILGGAQENTLFTVEGLQERPGCEVWLATGPPIGPEGQLVDRARAKGVRLLLVPELRRAIHPGRDLVSFFRLASICRRLRPHVVHTHSSKAGILGRLAARASGVPVVVHTIHGLPYHPYQGRLANLAYRWAEWIAARVSHCIITVSDHMAERAAAAGVVPRERMQTIYSGMEVEPFLAPRPERVEALRRRYGIAPGNRLVGVVARLAPLKGHEYLFAAAETLVPRHPELKFLLVGDGELRATFEEELARKKLRERFIFCGLVPPDQVPEHLALVDVVAHPSLREGLARVLPQGILAGKPVVSFDLDSAGEVVVPGKTGWLVPAEDSAGLAQAIESALKGGLPAWTAIERERFVERFRAQAMVSAIHSLYHRLLGKGMNGR